MRPFQGELFRKKQRSVDKKSSFEYLGEGSREKQDFREPVFPGRSFFRWIDRRKSTQNSIFCPNCLGITLFNDSASGRASLVRDALLHENDVEICALLFLVILIDLTISGG